MKTAFFYLAIVFITIFVAYLILMKALQIKQKNYYNQKILTAIVFSICLVLTIGMFIGYVLI